jgi:arsenate reductase (glutaredoxin)
LPKILSGFYLLILIQQFMEFNKRQVTIFYKPAEKKDRNTYDLAMQLSKHIREIDVMKDKITETQLIELLNHLKRSPTDLVDKSSDTYIKKYDGVDLTDDDWVKALIANPDMIFTPIVFLGDRGILVDTPSRVLDLDPTHGFNDRKT